MPDDKLYTARDLILAKREGFVDGVEETWQAFAKETEARPVCWRGAGQLAEQRYELPKTTRPRVVPLGDGYDYRYRNGVMERRHHRSGSWERTRWSVDEFRRVADLLANPTEEVDDA